MKGWRRRAVMGWGAILLVVALGCASPQTKPAAAPAAASPAPKPEDVQKEILAQDARRIEAMTQADAQALGEILRDDLTYIHSSGPLETKAQVIDEITSGKLRYRAIEPSEQTVRVFGDTAIVTGRAQLRVNSGGKGLGFWVRFTEVWVRANNAWQLAAWQSTRLPD